MELVLAHRNMDFDCLASQVAVSKLYPAACIVPAHPLSPRIMNFLSLYRDQLPIVDLQYVDWALVKHVYIVDCQKVDRLDDRARRRFLEYARYGAYTVFDHHETDAESLLPTASADSIVRKSGSAAAILVGKLQEQRIKLSALEATIIAAGIYEDTGCLTHLGSTELDALGIAYCLGQGADLERINHIIRPRFDDAQIELFERLKNAAENVQIKGMRITVCCFATDKFIDGLSELTSKLLENSASDALLAIVEMKDRIYVVARSETALFNLRGLVQALGGGGHGAAAFAVIRGETLFNVRERVLNFLMTDINAERTAEKIMSTPVRTIRSDMSMEEAGRIMLRHSLDGLVVMEHDDILGIVSKRDVDKARHHRLGHAPVRGFMSHPVFTVNAKSPLPEIQSMMVAEDIGRLPVLDDDGRLIGIVGRRELLAALYGEEGVGEPVPGAIAPHLHVSGTAHLIERIDDDLLHLYKQIGAVAAELNMVAYLVGGCVRDLVLNRQNFDLDFVVEGSARSLAQRLVEQMPDSYELLVEHSRFDTATLHVHAKTGLREVDIATARVEYYEYPAALPTVEPSSLEQDLFRRDFTINALALCLHPERFGEIVDYYNGLGDMNDKLIRILHPFSFIEDPTRIVRAARFGARLNFKLEARTKLQAQRAIQLGIFDNLGGVRLKEELRLILESDSRLVALDTLAELGGGLRFLDDQIVYGKRSRLRIRRAQTLLANYPLSHEYIVYLGTLLSELPIDSLSDALMRLRLGDDERSWILDAKTILQGMSELESCAKLSAVYRMLHGHDDHSLAIAVCLAPMGSHLRRSIRTYFEKLKNVKTHLRGNDLLAMGIRQGPEIGRLLESLLNARLDGELNTCDDEKAFVLARCESLTSRESV